MYADVHFLGGKLVTVREVDVTMKAHQRREGSPYSLFETTPWRRLSTTSGRPWGGLQTLTNFSRGNHKVRFLSERLLLPRSLQPPRVTRTMGKISRLAQITNSFVAKKEKEWIYNLIGQLLSNAPRTLGNLGFGVGEWEREWGVFFVGSKWMVNLIPWKGKAYI